MISYYFLLAFRSLRRNRVLTALVVIAIGIGIGASMTMLTVFLNVSGGAIPGKSAQLFAPQIDNWGPADRFGNTIDGIPPQVSYLDATGLMQAHAAQRQTATYFTSIALTPPDPQQPPLHVATRATYADFFPMFEVPFEYGAPWGRAEDEGRAPVVIITRELNDRVFGGADSVGRGLMLGTDIYRVVGVIDAWDPVPRFYDLFAGVLNGSKAQVYIPFTTAVAQHLQTEGGVKCRSGAGQLGSGEDAILRSECNWIAFWVELPTARSVSAYRDFLQRYADFQRQSGRFNWPARTALRNARQWLSYNHVVTPEIRIFTGAAFAFLIVCLLNAMGLMLAKFMARSASVSIRRALGACRADIFGQCFVETAVIGLTGGALGLGLMALGALGTDALAPELSARLGLGDVLIAVALAVGATVLAGLYPTWRASQLQPAWQLKAN